MTVESAPAEDLRMDVAALFGALWVNGNIPVNTAVAVSLILGVATFLATSKSTAGKSR